MGLNAPAGMPLVDELRGRADEGVAALDVGVEEGQRLAWVQGLQPEGDLRQFDGHRVDVDAVDAAGDDVAERRAERFQGRFRVVLADGGDALGDASGRRDEEVAGAAGRVADRHGQQGLGDRRRRVGARRGGGDLGLLGGVVEHRVQG